MKIPCKLLLFCVLVAACSETVAQSGPKRIWIPLSRILSPKGGRYGEPIYNYYTEASIGQPARPFKLQFDVGFGDFWVPKYQPKKFGLHYDLGFDCSNSSSCLDQAKTLNLTYLELGASGEVYEDLVRFEDATSLDGQKGLSVRQGFLALKETSDPRFTFLPFDGFFSIPSTLRSSSTNLTSMLVNLRDFGLIQKLQFSLFINPDLASPEGGELLLGGTDPNRYSDRIFWHKLINSDSRWSLNITSFKVGEQQVAKYTNVLGSTQAEADVSSYLTALYGPQQEVNRLRELLNATVYQNLALVDCRRVLSMPSITFTFDETPYKMLASNYVRKAQDSPMFKDETCYVAIGPIASPYKHKLWKIGDNFLGTYYSSFDVAKRRVGFARIRMDADPQWEQ